MSRDDVIEKMWKHVKSEQKRGRLRTVSFSKLADKPLDMEEVDECWLGFDSTYNAEPEAEE